MQKIFSILFVALLCLTACASQTAAPTLTLPATSTSLPPTLQPTPTLEPTATVAPTETPAPTATPEVTRVEDFFGAGPAEIRHISKSEDLTQKYLGDPSLITNTVKFTNGILDAGTRGSVLKFNATLVSYQIDNFTLTDPKDPKIPATGEVLTTRYAIKNTDGSISVFEVQSFGGMFVEDSYNSILEQEGKLKVGKEYIFGLQYNPSTASSYNREKFIKETQKKVEGSPVEKIIYISLYFSAPKVAITESGLIKIITSSPNTVTKLDNKYGGFGLYSN